MLIFSRNVCRCGAEPKRGLQTRPRRRRVIGRSSHSRRAVTALCILMILLVGCTGKVEPDPSTISAGLHWPDDHVATVWMTTKISDGERIQATGTVFVQIWEAEEVDDTYEPVGSPIYEFTQELTPDSYPEVDPACEPCMLAGNHLIVSLQAIPFDYLDTKPQSSVGLLTVLFSTTSGQDLTVSVPFGFPDGIKCD